MYSVLPFALASGLFVATLACLELGFRFGDRSLRRDPEHSHEGIGTIEAAVFALLGLLLALAFAGGTSRLDARRQLIIEEANAIGTAYLRIDLLPPDQQPPMRRLFRDYLDARLRFYEVLANRSDAAQEAERVGHLQQEIWARAGTTATSDPTQNVGRLVLPAINQMIDITTSRMIALHTHLPVLIFLLLVVVALLSALLGGYTAAKRRRRSWLHMIAFAATVAVTVFVVIDLDYPRYGLIRLDTADKALLDLRRSIR